MPETQWYYARNNTQEGPVSEAELARILTDQKLPSSTLIWAEHLDRWTAAGDVEPFKHQVNSSETYTIAPKPWHRLIARMIDNSIYSIPYLLSCGALFLVLNSIHRFEKNDAMIIVALIIALLSPTPFILESCLLGTFGSTPGKLLLNSRVITQSHEKLSFLQAFQRTGAVWVRGGSLAGYFPILGFLGFLALGVYQYTQLVTYGIVSWDRNQDLLYQHGKISSARLGGLAAVLFGISIWFGAVGFFMIEQFKLFFSS